MSAKAAFLEAARLDDGPGRVAAIAAWVQSLVEAGEEPPVLVGGGAVELYSGGAYRTGDLDFVGTLGSNAVRQLEAVGFHRQGRHWVNEEYRLFLEFPGTALGEGETAATIEVDKYSVLVIGLEELIVDRMAAWLFWNSEVDGINAFRLTRVAAGDIEWKRLREMAQASEVDQALQALERFGDQWKGREPTSEDLATWARDALRGVR